MKSLCQTVIYGRTNPYLGTLIMFYENLLVPEVLPLQWSDQKAKCRKDFQVCCQAEWQPRRLSAVQPKNNIDAYQKIQPSLSNIMHATYITKDIVR